MKHLIMGCMLLCAAFAHAQKVQGVVSDASSGQKLPGAIVRWLHSTNAVLTDASGVFSIERTTASDSLEIILVGYITKQVAAIDGPMNISLQEIGLETSVVNVESEQSAKRINTLDAVKFETMSEKELCKAACCSLSESFETNASVDASFTDAITGTRQIKMLGLDGRYTQISFDNIPSVRGLSTIYGLSYLPGPWINEISISKGAGSVTAGYESMTGQINVANKSSEMKERVFINAYAGSQGRFEVNTLLRQPVGKSWSSMWMAHASSAQLRFDMNKDGFLDNPLFRNLLLRNEWSLRPQNSNWRGEYAASYSTHSNVSGKQDYDPKDEVRSQLWGVHVNTQRAEASAKTGYVFNASGTKSFGSQLSAAWHNQSGVYGFRPYQGKQQNVRANLLFASELSESIKQTSGVSMVHDTYIEQLAAANFNRHETVVGAFSEWAFNVKKKLLIMPGVRVDYSNVYGAFFTPRLHVRYSVTEKSTLKLAAGKGYRSPVLLMDNVGMFASNRTIRIDSTGKGLFGLPMESAWNFGLVWIQKFKINSRDASLTIDAYRTVFENQVVVDWETPREVQFYALDGKSFSNSVQAEVMASPIRRFEVRLAYRWLEAFTDYRQGQLFKPLVAKHRFFVNLAFSTKEKDNGAKWMFDATARWLGGQRLPQTTDNPENLRLPANVPGYWIMNAQISRHFNKSFEFYIGGENLTNFFISNPIISAQDPSSPSFDASMVWGPVFGRMGYVGLRWRIGQ